MTWLEKDSKYIWHPFTKQPAKNLVHIVKGEGCYLYDEEGKKYLDGISSWWVNLHGHAHPYIAEKIAEQARNLEHVLFAGFTHTPAIAFAEKLIQWLPHSFSKVFYSDNGSTAVEVALKMAIQYWHNRGEKKTGIIAFENAYHGDTFGAMSAAGSNTFNLPFAPLMFEVNQVKVPTEETLQESIAAFKKLVETGNIAAFIFEPLIQGSCGMLMHQPEHLDVLLAMAKEHKIICIADEVMTGFYRTGKPFASSYLNESPDIICLSKGITGGFLPLGVTAVKEKIYEAFPGNESSKTFYHGHSYTANPIACAAALASLDLLQKDSCKAQIEMISNLNIAFKNRIETHHFVKEARTCGTILAIELQTNEETSYHNSIRDFAYEFFLTKGVLLRPLGNIVYIMPPYSITKTELEFIHQTMKEGVDFLSNKFKN